MKTALRDAINKLSEKKIEPVVIGHPMRNIQRQDSLVYFSDAIEVLEEFEVALLNEIDEKRIKETKTSY